MARQRIDVKQAAQILGISTDAVHKRAKRGTLSSDKDPDGRVFVYLDNDLDDGYKRPDNGYTSNGNGPEGRTDQRDELVEELRDQIAFLRRELAAERSAHGETRQLALINARRVQAIEAPEPPESRETAPETPAGTNTQDPAPASETESSRPGWFRRFFGFK